MTSVVVSRFRSSSCPAVSAASSSVIGLGRQKAQTRYRGPLVDAAHAGDCRRLRGPVVRADQNRIVQRCPRARKTAATAPSAGVSRAGGESRARASQQASKVSCPGSRVRAAAQRRLRVSPHPPRHRDRRHRQPALLPALRFSIRRGRTGCVHPTDRLPRIAADRRHPAARSSVAEQRTHDTLTGTVDA